MSINAVPQKSGGLYWAKYDTDKKFPFIIAVVGEPPFMKARAWDIVRNETFVITDTDKLIWGPQILRPDETGMRDV